MATDKSVYEGILTSLTDIRHRLQDVDDAVEAVDNGSEVDAEFSALFDKLSTIDDWLNGEIVRVEQEVVMKDFLVGLKALMNEYQAKFELGNSESGYGENWGQGSVTGMKVTVVKDGVTVSKVIEKVVIVDSDF